MGSYAAAISLLQTLQRISESDDFLSHSDKLCLLDEMYSVLEKMEEISSSKKVDAAAYERRIIDAVQIFQDLIDSHMSDRDHDDIGFTLSLSQQIGIVKEEITSFLTATDQICSSRYSNFASSDYNTHNQQQNLLVGLDDQIRELKQWIFDPILLHFTFRSLCVSEAKSEKFFHILKKYTDCTPENIKSQQRLCVHNNVVLAFTQVHEWMKFVPNAQSLLCFGPKQQYPVSVPSCFRLLKVLDALAIRFYEFPHQLLALLHLTYLSITCDGELPNSISSLWNLEVLIFTRHHNIKLSNNGPVYLPIDIWNMHKLKQLYCKGFDLPPLPDDSHLESLLTVSGVSVHSCTVEVLSRIPNLNRIAVQIESAHNSTETFNFFGHLASVYVKFESFKCVVVNPNLSSQIVRSVPNFPMNIRKISLSGCGLPWENMEVIASLPYLIVLKLRWYAFCGPLWKTSQGRGKFPSLKFLLLEDLDIENLEFDIPYLTRVIVRHCYKLKNISDQFNYTDLLEVDDCSPSFMKKMREWRSFLRRKAEIRSSVTDL